MSMICYLKFHAPDVSAKVGKVYFSVANKILIPTTMGLVHSFILTTNGKPFLEKFHLIKDADASREAFSGQKKGKKELCGFSVLSLRDLFFLEGKIIVFSYMNVVMTQIPD